MQLRVGGKGNEALGGVPGDLIVLIEEVPHESLTRDGENLHYELTMSFLRLHSVQVLRFYRKWCS